MADLITLTIDEHQVRVPKGTLIVEAAKTVGITIPVFCYHPKMKPVGACRMCLVEVGTPRRNPDGSPALTPEGAPVIAFMPKPQTACTMPVSEGMVVRTHSPAVIKAQKGILEFLLINHPLDCPVCDKGGECPLQDQTYQFGPGESRFEPADKLHFLKPIDLSERIALDRERCIMCFRCVRFQDKIAGDPQIDVFERGARSEIAVVPGQAFDSNFSGNTIELCPVGALTSTEFRFRARSWEMQNVAAVCPLCAVGCNLTLQVRSNKLLRILARDNEEVNEVWICDRGRFGYEYVNENRLTTPQVRKGVALEAAPWSAATKAAALALGHVVKTYGPAAVGGIASPRLTNEDLYLFQKLMRAVIGTNNVDHRISGRPVGGTPMTVSIAALEDARSIFVIGSDIFDELPILALRVRKAAVHKQAKLVMAAARPVKLTREAHAWLKHGEGAELFVAQALIAALRGEPTDKPAAAAGLSADAVDQAAKLLAGAAPIILCGQNLAESARGPEVMATLHTLTDLTGGTLNSLVLGANEQGARDMGCAPGLLPGRRPVSDGEARREMAALWGVESLPGTPALSGREMLAAAAQGKLKALYLVGIDPLAAVAGDAALVEAALNKLEVLIVQDMAPSKVSPLAHILLPGYSFAEAEGTYTNVEGRVQWAEAALLPEGDMRPDWRIVAEIAAEMTGSASPYGSAAAVLREIAAVVPAYAGLTPGKLAETGLRV